MAQCYRALLLTILVEVLSYCTVSDICRHSAGSSSPQLLPEGSLPAAVKNS